MCTSFVLYTPKTFIGMNFDFPECPIYISRVGKNQLVVYQQINNKLCATFGFTRSGTFMNLQMVPSDDRNRYRRGKDCVHIVRVFMDVMADKLPAAQIFPTLGRKTIVSVPNFSLHSLVASGGHNACLIEPGRGILPISAQEDYLLLTNFLILDDEGRKSTNITGDGAERYVICERMLQEQRSDFDINAGFSILKATAQTAGEYPTRLSCLFLPEEGTISFCINHDFSRRFVFSFSDFSIHNGEGLTQVRSTPVGPRGVELSALSTWL